jgi:hypothetical protein
MISTPGLLRCAEDQFLHGHLLSGRIVDYVDFEESLAVGSIAQEQLAHAALLIELAGYDVDGRDDLVYERPLADWWPSSVLALELTDWPSTVVRSLLISAAGLVWTRSILADAEPAVLAAARAMLAEQELHLRHWSTWVRLLAGDQRTRAEIHACCADVVPLAGDVFGDAPGMPPESVRQSLHEAFAAELGRVVTLVELSSDLLGGSPRQRVSGADQPRIASIVNTVRMLRVGPDDGVRAVYR